MTPTLSLWQPFASLIFTAPPIKVHETRPRAFPAKYKGQRVAIHAAATFPAKHLISGDLHRLCCRVFGWEYRHSLPRGVVLGTVELVEAVPIKGVPPDVSADDAAAGDWRPGRWSWLLREPELLTPALPVKGAQGWFFVELPVDIRALRVKP